MASFGPKCDSHAGELVGQPFADLQRAVVRRGNIVRRPQDFIRPRKPLEVDEDGAVRHRRSYASENNRDGYHSHSVNCRGPHKGRLCLSRFRRQRLGPATEVSEKAASHINSRGPKVISVSSKPVGFLRRQRADHAPMSVVVMSAHDRSWAEC